MRSFKLLMTFALLLLAQSAQADDTTWPWVLLSGQFGGTAHSLGYAPYAATPSTGPDMGVFYMGGDDGGVWRSKDCGASWAPVNGGLPMSTGINGGYLGEPGVCTVAPESCPTTHGVQYGGALSLGTDVSFPVTAGRAPAGLLPTSTTGGDAVVYRPSPLAFSRDDGLNWFRLSPACMNSKNDGVQTAVPGTGPIAVDQGLGHEGHIVVAATARIPSGYESRDVSGCIGGTSEAGDSFVCRVRQIAWTDDVTEQMNTSIVETLAMAPAAGYLLDSAGRANGNAWKFSSLNHLAAARDPWNESKCIPKLPKAPCHPRTQMYCHGDEFPAQIEDACLESSSQDCNCIDSTECRYPIVMGLEIDPRNGYVYASTDVGLLVSTDEVGGGRSWARGPNDPGPEGMTPPAARPNNSVTYHTEKTVQLLTGVAPGKTDAAGAVDSDGVWDLNQSPWRIASVGKMSMVFTPSVGVDPTVVPRYPSRRQRGSVEAYLPVTWYTFEQGHQVTRSSVFHAQVGPDGDGEDTLVFRDVNTTLKQGGLGVPLVTPEAYPLLALPKLPQGQQYSANHCYDPAVENFRCQLTAKVVAAAPSSPGIAYVFMASESNAAPPPIDSDCQPGYCPDKQCTTHFDSCLLMTGIYQTLDHGETWSLVLGTGLPQGVGDLASVEALRVDRANPYVAMTMGTLGQFLVQPVHASPGAPQGTNVAPYGCDQLTGNSLGNWFDANLAFCRKDLVSTDICGWLQGPGVGAVHRKCQSSADGTKHYCDTLGAGVDSTGNVANAQANPPSLPPFCAHHFPSEWFGQTTAVAQACEDCLALEAAAGQCGAEFHPLTQTGELRSPSQTGKPVRCCLGAVRLGTTSSSGQSTNTGASEEWVYASAVLDVANALAAGGKYTVTLFAGEDNSAGVAATPLSVGTSSAWNLFNKDLIAGIDEIVGIVPVDSKFSAGLLGVGSWGAWLLADSQGIEGVAQLGFVGGPVPGANAKMSLSQGLFQLRAGSPIAKLDTWGKRTVLTAPFKGFGRRFGHFGFVKGPSACFGSFHDAKSDGPEQLLKLGFPVPGDDPGQVPSYLNPFPSSCVRWLLGAWPGVGVAAAPIVESTTDSGATKAKPDEWIHDYNSEKGFTGAKQLPGVRVLYTTPFAVQDDGRLPLSVDGANDKLGPCISDMDWQPTVASAGYVWIAVGAATSDDKACDPQFVDGGVTLSPGIYRRKFDGAMPDAAEVWERIGGPGASNVDFGAGRAIADPAVVKVSLGVAPDANGTHHSLFVANWSTNQDCAGGLYRLDLDSVATAGGSAVLSPQWRLIWRQDAISSLAVGSSKDRLLAAVTTTDDARVVDDVMYVNTKNPVSVAAEDAASHQPGLYRIAADSTAGAIMHPLNLPGRFACEGWRDEAGAQESALARCSVSSSLATSSCDSIVTNSPGHSAGGYASASLNVLSVNEAGGIPGKIIVGTAGDGAYQTILNFDAPDYYRFDSECITTGDCNIPDGLSLHDAWRSEFAELRLAYTYPAPAHDFDGTVRVNGVDLPCPIGPYAHCLPTSGMVGRKVQHAFDLPYAARSSGASRIVLDGSRASAQASHAQIIVSTDAAAGTAVTVRTGVLASFAANNVESVTRLRANFDRPLLEPAMLDLNGRKIGPIPPGATEFVTANNSLREGMNSAVLTSDGVSYSRVATVDFARGHMATAIGRKDLHENATQFGIWVQREEFRRGTAWLQLTLADASRPTVAVLNGTSVHVLQQSPWVRHEQSDPTGVVRVLVDWNNVATGMNSVVATTTPCDGAACGPISNVTSAAIVWDYDDNPAHPMLRPEACGNGQDDDCNGSTDDVGQEPCDGPDVDGCALGRLTCGPTPTCIEDGLYVPPSAHRLREITMHASSLDFVTTQGTYNVPAQMDFPVLGTLKDGRDLGDISQMLPVALGPDAKLTKIKLNLTGDAQGDWGNGRTGPVVVRSAPTDDGQVFTLDFGTGAKLVSGGRFVIMAQPLNRASLDQTFGCPGGTFTYPSSINVVSMCDMPSVDCQQTASAAPWCDAAPQSMSCPTCTGDWDGCADGIWSSVGGGDPMCWGDNNPITSDAHDASTLSMSVNTVQWLFSGGLTAVSNFHPPLVLDLGKLADGQTDVLSELIVPPQGMERWLEGAWLQGEVQAEVGSGGAPFGVQLRSGPTDTGDTLFLRAAPGSIPGAGPLNAHLNPSSTVNLRHIYACWDGGRTIANEVEMVVNLPSGQGGTGGQGSGGNGQQSSGGSQGGSGSQPGGGSTNSGGSGSSSSNGPTTCTTWMYPTALTQYLTNVTFYYDDNTSEQLPLGSGVTFNMAAALVGGDEFGGTMIPLPTSGSTTAELTAMYFTGAISGMAAPWSGPQLFSAVAAPNQPMSPSNPAQTGMLFTFETAWRPQVGTPLRIVLSPIASTDARIYQCSDNTAQITSTLTVRAYTPSP